MLSKVTCLFTKTNFPSNKDKGGLVQVCLSDINMSYFIVYLLYIVINFNKFIITIFIFTYNILHIYMARYEYFYNCLQIVLISAYFARF